MSGESSKQGIVVLGVRLMPPTAPHYVALGKQFPGPHNP